MKARRTTIATVTAAAALSTLTGLGTQTAFAGTTEPASHAGTPAVTRSISYVARTQELSADGTTSWGVGCPAGTLPVGGALIQDPRLESVTQAGFHTSTATGKFDGYQASVRVSGLRAGGKVQFAVQAACMPATTPLVYLIHIQIIPGNGIISWGVGCPARTLPVGGGALIQDPRLESVTQAGFHTSTATGRFDGYQASVRVSGLRAGGKVQFAVQAACMPATTRLVYVAHKQVFPPPGRMVPPKACQAGICPVSGGTAGGPQFESVTQAGFHTSTATGKLDGYQASIKLGARPGGSKVLFAVQVVCMPAQTPPVYGPPAPAWPAPRNTAWSVACPAGTNPAAGGATVENQVTGVSLGLSRRWARHGLEMRRSALPAGENRTAE